MKKPEAPYRLIWTLWELYRESEKEWNYRNRKHWNFFTITQ